MVSTREEQSSPLWSCPGWGASRRLMNDATSDFVSCEVISDAWEWVLVYRHFLESAFR